MAEIKAGTRLRSVVCATELMVVAGPGSEVDIRCGGAPMIVIGQDAPDGATLDASAADGTALGKRYVDAEATVEALCTKPGEGSLAVGDAPMTLKEAKPLPSSD